VVARRRGAEATRPGPAARKGLLDGFADQRRNRGLAFEGEPVKVIPHRTFEGDGGALHDTMIALVMHQTER
jgi:hypothetical protein